MAHHYGAVHAREDEDIRAVFQECGIPDWDVWKVAPGDNFPYRPEDRGFDEVYRHGGAE